MAGQPMLAWLIERLRHVKEVGKIVVATSSHQSDDAIFGLSRDMNISCSRGRLDDVLDRFIGVSREYGFDAVVRISGDSPVLDPALVDKAVVMFRAEKVDLVTNVRPRTYPKGQSVEVVSREALERAGETATEEDREHVTAHMYRHHGEYRIGSFSAKVPNPDVQMAVDTEADFQLMEQLMLAMTRPHWDYGVDELVRLYNSLVPCGKMQ